MGISFQSEEKARASVEQEVGSHTFDEVRSESVEDWNRILGRFEVEGGTMEARKLFASCLYRIFCMPTYLGTDESPFPKSKVPQFTDFYCLWDSVRNANSFFHLFFPALSAQMMNALLDIAENTGWLPDAHIAGSFGFMQGGSSADIILGEAVQKGVPSVDAERALRWTSKNAKEPSPCPLVKGRLYREDYEQLGYIPAGCDWHPVSRHIEYAYQDGCISRMAGVLAKTARDAGNKTDAERYTQIESEFLARSERIWNLWNASVSAFVPRNKDGDWPSDYDPWSKGDPDVYEGSVVVWSFNALQDIQGLIDRMGGPQRFVERLDRLFARAFVQRREKHFEIKETRMHIPHLYTYAGRPDRAADRVRESLECYSAGEDGLPDNEDMGCQSGYYLWNSIGLYPIYGQTHYMLAPPLFETVKIKLSPDVQLNDQARIENLLPSDDDSELLITTDTSLGKRYIISATLGGKPLNRAWVRHCEIANGAQIHFVLSDEPNDWGTREPPPNGIRRP